MPRITDISIDKNFIGGRVTQATGLDFPPNACVDELNCVFNERGIASRRHGFDYELNFTEDSLNGSGKAISTFLWKNASGDGTLDLVVRQVGTALHFFDVLNNFGVSQGRLSSTVDLTDFIPADTPANDPTAVECTYASGLSNLFVFNPVLEPFYVTFDTVTRNVTGTIIHVQIRDVEGVNDDLNVDNRPPSLSVEHEYNLLNQGWDSDKITAWAIANSDYPSNSDVWWLYRDPVTEVFDPTVETDFNRGNSPAPKGHNVLNAFFQERSGQPDESTEGARPAIGAFFAGRVWFANINYTGWSTKILFSQTIDSPEKFGKCHQELDPTSETLFDQLPTDGGIINIPETGAVFALIPFNNRLLVFAYNGIWSITGSQGIGFTATDYTPSRLSTIRSISSTSFVDVSGIPTWWNPEGIYSVEVGQNDSLQIKSLTDDKIKIFYQEDIPYLSKKNVKGAFNPLTHIIQWLYKSESTTDITQKYEYDRILNFNTLSGAFYVWEVAPNSPLNLNGIVVMNAVTSNTSGINSIPVVDGSGNPVYDSHGNQVVIYTLSDPGELFTVTKYLISDPIAAKFSWADTKANTYTDWNSHEDGELTYSSYFVPGYKLPTKGVQKIQANYIYLFSNATQPTSYYLQTQWNYSNTGESGKWSNNVLVENSDTTIDIHRRKIKTRGHGFVFNMKISSNGNEPFDIIGWSTLLTGNQNA